MSTQTPPQDPAAGGDDLSALAWVQAELRRSLENAHKALRRYVRESAGVAQSDVDAVDPAVLRSARVQIHQGVGALELVGLPAVATALRAGEAAVQRMAARPKLATKAAVEIIEHLSHAVIDFLGRRLAGKDIAPLALFPQYAAAQALAGAERVHPADLWAHDWQWRSLPRDETAAPRQPDDDTRGEMEYLTLALMRAPDPAAQRRMSDLCAGLGAGAGAELATLWQLAAACFEAQAAGLVAADLHTKRVGSRLLAMLRAAARGQRDVPVRLAQDLLFYVVRAPLPADASTLPRLAALQSVWPGDPSARGDYERPRLGLFDPAVVQQARKRVAGAKDAWSAVCGGELQRLAGLGESFTLLADSVQRLFPGGETLGQALQAAAAQAAAAQRAPDPEQAMEVATAILYLDAVLEDGELDAPVLRERVPHLAQRISDVGAGAGAQPLEQWMEDLYRRVSDRQTMGSVVQELRASLSVVEKQIDQYFRDPSQRELLIPVPAQLSVMRGVLSVLGMDQASHAVLRMRDDIDALAETEVDPQRAIQAGTFDRLADNLGALSFLIDMLSVQPVLAKTLFRFDPETGNLSAVMGQSERVSAFAAFDVSAPAEASPASAPSAAPAPAASGLEDDAEMRDVFLEEAGEVIAGARASLTRLDQPGGDVLAEMTNIRRAFHTLKGSSRMVGLKAFGEAAWACEQLYNARLAQHAQMDGPLHGFTGEALGYLAGWVDAIATGAAAGHAQEAVTAAADALRVEGRHQPLPAPGVAAPPIAEAASMAQPAAAPDVMPPEAWPAPVFEPGSETLPVFGFAPEPAPGSESEPVPADGTAPEPGPAPDEAPSLSLPASGPGSPPDLRTLVPDLPSADDLAMPSLDLGEPGPAVPAPDTAGPVAHADASAPAAPPTAVEPVEPVEPVGEAASAEPWSAAEPSPPVPDFELDLAAFDAPPEAAAPSPDLPPLPPVDEVLDLGQPETPALPESMGEPEVIELSAADFDLEFSEAVEPAMAPDTAPSPAEAPPADTAPLAGEPVDAAPPVAGRPDVERPHAGSVDLDLPAAEVAWEPEVLAFAPLAPAAPIGAAPQDMAEPSPAGQAPSHAPLPTSPQTPQEALPEIAPELPPELPPEGWPEVPPAFPPEAPATATAEAPAPFAETPADAGGDETVKVVGDLRIAIPLFNIFLNEADEQSRRLGTEIAEWVLEPDRPMGETAIALAHSLAGNSGTVGFTDLSMLARAFEHALMRSREVGHASDGEGDLFTAAAAEIRRLLHQFAAGFLKPVDAALMLRLADHEIATSNPERDTESPELDDSIAGELAPLPLPTEPLPSPAAFVDEDDLDAVDAIDRDLFPIFEEEADELLPQLRGRLSDWLRQPADASAPAACMRTLHTFKGGARLAGAMRVGELAHRLETDIERLSVQDAVAPADVEQLLGKADTMASLFDRLRRHPAPPPPPPPPAAAQPLPLPVEAPQQTPEQASASEPVPAPAVAPAAPAVAADAVAGADVEGTSVQGPRTPDTTPPIDWRRFAATAGAPVLPRADDEASAATAGSGQATVRVRAPLLDRLVNQAGEVSITRARIESAMRTLQGSLGDLTENLDKLRRHLRDIELQAETQISARIEAAKATAEGFDPLEMDRFTRFQEVTRMMAESVNDVATVQRGLQRALQTSEDELAAQARLTRDLQDDLLRTRMVEFESLADRLYRVVRQAAKETGKAVRLDLEGGSIEVDRGVLERMVGPFEHLLRNCVAHGIESADRRRAAGKPEAGTITVAAHQEGNEIGVEVRDDGGGLDLGRIRARAVERGLLAPDAMPADDALAQMIFVPGFSTADQVSGLAGRGVGMDVVRSEVVAMGGRIETVTRPGQGTSFRLLLPLTTAVTQVVMLRFGDRQVAVPSTLVEVVRRAKADEVERCYASGAYALDGAEIPFYWLGALLQASGRGGTGERSQTLVVLRSASQRVAVHVDEVVGNQEVVVKNLGPQLSHLPGLAGITLLPSGAVAMIYNPVALGAVYGDEARALMRARPAPDAPLAVVAPVALRPLILIVDDSLTVRRVTQRLLLREGYRVALAKDGMDALEQLAAERPALLLSDIEMPRMDGFDLVRNLRSDPRLKDLPVIMITSRIAPKHREYAAELGVQHYLGKPYAEDELLALVAQHVTADIPL